MVRVRGHRPFPDVFDDCLIGYFSAHESVAHRSGNLPHWRQPGVTYFVTFRCADALPQTKLREWREELSEWTRSHPAPVGPKDREEYHRRFSARIQHWLDAGYGTCPLRQPSNRQIVETSLRHFGGKRYVLHESTVAANHVHVLVSPTDEWELSAILHSWKSYSASLINQREHRRGTFWQKESFDHIVRSPASFAKFREYIRSHG